MVDYTDQSPLAHSQLWHSRVRAVPAHDSTTYPVFGTAFAGGFLLPKFHLRRGDGEPTSEQKIQRRQRPRAGSPQMKQDQSVQFNNQTQNNINTGDYQ